ncbi:class II fructose-bisphosphate aldolase [Streptomyces sp. SCSIO 30461]|uniref:class II fructose-bisphosphate aldolase n=1 Tax=Streptomyces sp. SCSIO 30461 TaxID=3118085 RepID=UPI0030CDC973
MPMARTGTLVAEAARSWSAVAAFSVITLEHAEAVIAGAESAGAPAILQISENAVKYRHGRVRPLARAALEVARDAAVPAALQLDHVTGGELLRQAADAGFSSLTYDASRLPYEANLVATRAAADWAHTRGLWIEAELGEVDGKGGAAPRDAHAPCARTDPDEAQAFAAVAGVDALAVAVGSTHGMTTRTAVLDRPLLARLAAAVDVPLVLHGSSGVPDEELSAAVRGGMVKINIGTALNLAMTRAIRARLTAHADEVDSRAHLAAGRAAMADGHPAGPLAARGRPVGLVIVTGRLFSNCRSDEPG